MCSLRFPALVAIAIAAGLAPAHAASLGNDVFDVFAGRPGAASPYLGASALGGGPWATFESNGAGSSGLPSDPMSIVSDQYGRFAKSSPDGVDFSAILAGNVTRVAVGKSANAVKLTDPGLMFDANPFVSSMGEALGSFEPNARADQISAGHERPAQAGPSVPLPPALPLLAVAVIALAGFGYGLNRWVAPRDRKIL